MDESRLKTALSEQRRWGGKLGSVLVEMGFIDEPTMVAVLAQQLQLQTVDLDAAKLPPKVVDALRLDLAERYGVFPLVHDAGTKSLKLATSDPTNVEALNELAFATNLKIEPVVATASAIDRAIRRYYFGEAAEAPVTAQTSMAVSDTMYELDELMGSGVSAKPTAPGGGVNPPASAPPPIDRQWMQEFVVLREQVTALEGLVSSQVKATRALLELLMEAGVVGRDEYLAKLHRPDDKA